MDFALVWRPRVAQVRFAFIQSHAIVHVFTLHRSSLCLTRIQPIEHVQSRRTVTLMVHFSYMASMDMCAHQSHAFVRDVSCAKTALGGLASSFGTHDSISPPQCQRYVPLSLSHRRVPLTLHPATHSVSCPEALIAFLPVATPGSMVSGPRAPSMVSLGYSSRCRCRAASRHIVCTIRCCISHSGRAETLKDRGGVVDAVDALWKRKTKVLVSPILTA